MDAKNEIREFLTSRRANITPNQVGLPIYGDNRRVPGLRHEEVALLAGVSVDYYTRLERGNASGVSDSVLDALARALQLDEAERSHLIDLARATQPAAATRRRRAAKQQIRPAVQRILDAMTQAPALSATGAWTSSPPISSATLSIQPTSPQATLPSTARFVFLDTRSEGFYDDWDHVANEVVAILRSEAGRNPYDRELTNLIGELSTQSEAFRGKWAAHNVRFHDTGTKRLHHPIVGDLELTYEAMELSADTGLVMFAYTAEPGTKSETSLRPSEAGQQPPSSAKSAPPTKPERQPSAPRTARGPAARARRLDRARQHRAVSAPGRAGSRSSARPRLRHPLVANLETRPVVSTPAVIADRPEFRSGMNSGAAPSADGAAPRRLPIHSLVLASRRPRYRSRDRAGTHCPADLTPQMDDRQQRAAGSDEMTARPGQRQRGDRGRGHPRYGPCLRKT